MTSVKLSADSVLMKEKESVEIRKRLLWEMKLIEWPKYSSVLRKRVVGSRQKSRRFSAKESSVLSKRIDGAKRKQSIYSQILLNCYAVGGSKTGPKHSKIIVFPLGFREAFSLLSSCLYGFIWSNTIELGGFGKDTCFFDEMQYPYEDTEQPYFFMADDNGDIQEWFP